MSLFSEILKIFSFLVCIGISISISSVGGWSLDLSKFCSCTVHLAIFNASQKYMDWTTDFISKNPNVLLTVIAQKQTSQELQPVQPSIHMKQSKCTVNIVINAEEQEDIFNYANANAHTDQSDAHSTFILVRESNPALNFTSAYRFPFRAIFVVASSQEDNLRFYFFCPMCKDPMQPIQNNSLSLSSPSPKQFQSDWVQVLVGYHSFHFKGVSNKVCLHRQNIVNISTNCIISGSLENLAFLLNFSIVYESTDRGLFDQPNGFIKNNGKWGDARTKQWFYQFDGFFLFYCIPRNVTNKVLGEGIQTWFIVYEQNVWSVLLLTITFTTVSCSLLSLGSQQMQPFGFMKTILTKCFYIYSTLTRQHVPSNERAMKAFSFIIALLLYVYENEFSSFVIAKINPKPIPSSLELVANNYTVVNIVGNVSYWENLSQLNFGNILRLLYGEEIFKLDSQFQTIEKPEVAPSFATIVQHATEGRVAILELVEKYISKLPVFAEVSQNSLISPTVCFVTPNDIYRTRTSWTLYIQFKYKLWLTYVWLKETGVENHWHKLVATSTKHRFYNSLNETLGDIVRVKDTINLKQLTSMMLLCLGLMVGSGVILLIEIEIGNNNYSFNKITALK